MTKLDEVKPFYRPRRPRRWVPGKCYEYATKEALAYCEAGKPLPALVVIHGLYSPRGSPVEHAWIERGGFAYDWQTLVMGGKPLPLAVFHEANRTRVHTRYDVSDVIRLALEKKHSGPWDDRAEEEIRAWANALRAEMLTAGGERT
jgi:hypothetical protein